MKLSETIIGQRLGNYLIQEPLGVGGMARVYKGLDTMLKRPVAVKVIEKSLRTSATYAQRFEREAQSVANLHHPNIVNVFYFGNEDSLYYLVMEYIDGTDLDAIMRNYSKSGELMPYADVMRILEAIASALDYAHGQGVIHRDVKPSNIMLERSGRTVLTDFGLALKVSEGTIGDTFGTPQYIAPEQAKNSANAVSQSDLYSLGVVAYELLTGVLPFDDPSPTALAMQHLMAAVPSPRVFNPQLAVEIEQVLFKVLAKTPNERYPTGAAFCTALRHGLEATLRSASVPAKSVVVPPVGAEVPSMRRLSMQTAVDKVDQELAMQQATGQSLTHSADSVQLLSDTWRKVNSSNWLPYVVAMSIVLVALTIFALILAGDSGGQTATPTSTDAPTHIIMLAATVEVTEEPTVLLSDTPLPTATFTPVPPTNTAILPSETAVPPSLTPEPPTATAVPPTETALPQPPVPPTAEPPTAAPVVPTDSPPGPTAAPADWLPVSFVYNNEGFWWLNGSGRSISAQSIRFERVGGSQSFSGSRWAFWTMEPGRCMEIRFADISNPQRPNGCRPNAFFTPTRSQGIDFWTGSGQFRVLWNDTEIAICEITAGQCSAAVPG